MFDDLTLKDVPATPKYINGFAFYRVKTDYKNWTWKTSDLRYFNMHISSKSGYHSYCKIGKCEGSWDHYKNPHCAFKSTSYQHQPNHINWKGICGNRRITLCDICDHIPEHEGCGARKLTLTLKQKKLQYTIWVTTLVGNAQTQNLQKRSEDLKLEKPAKVDLQRVWP